MKRAPAIRDIGLAPQRMTVCKVRLPGPESIWPYDCFSFFYLLFFIYCRRFGRKVSLTRRNPAGARLTYPACLETICLSDFFGIASRFRCFYLQIFRSDARRSIGPLIVFGPELLEIVPQYSLTVLIERLERLLRRTVIEAKVLDHLGRTHQKYELDVPANQLQVTDPVPKSLSYRFLISPQKWRGHADWRRDMLPGDLEHLPDKALRCPVRHRDQTAG